MERLSGYVNNAAEYFDDLSGRYFKKWHISEERERLRDIPKEIAYCNISALSELTWKILSRSSKLINNIEDYLLGKETKK